MLTFEKVLGPTEKTLGPISSPPSDEARALLVAVLERHGWKYLPRVARADELLSRFALFDERCARVAETLRGNPELATEAREICAKLEVLAQARRMESNAIQVAVAAFMSRMRTPPPVEPRGARPASDAPPAIASRWLRSATLIGEQAEEMEALLDHIPNERWRARLAEYADQLRTVAESTPWERLSRLAEVEEAKPEEPGVLDPGVFDAIGFVAPDAVALPPAEAIEHCQRLVPQLNSEAAHLENLARAVSRHPAARLHEREAELMRAAARHELARALEKPIGEAEATVLVRVIGEGLGNVFAELVAALTRFEWYFEQGEAPCQTRQHGLRGDGH